MSNIYELPSNELQSSSVEFCTDDLPEWCRVLYASIL